MIKNELNDVKWYVKIPENSSAKKHRVKENGDSLESDPNCNHLKK